MDGARIDTGFPYGDDAHNASYGRRLGSTTASHGIAGVDEGTKQGGLKREDVFVTFRIGPRGHMQDFEYRQGLTVVSELAAGCRGFKNADLMRSSP